MKFQCELPDVRRSKAGEVFMPLRPSFFRTSSRLARVAVAVCAAAPLTLVAVVTAGIEQPGGASSAHVGPVYPAPGSGKLTTTGAEGQTGGVTFSFSKVKTNKFKSMVWGLWYPKYPATWSFGLNTATLAFDSTDSILASGEAVYSGAAEFPNLDGSTPTLPIRLVVQAEGGLAMETSAAAQLGVKKSVGAVIPVTGNWSVNLTFEVSPDSGATWEAADTYYDNTPHQEGSTSSSVNGAFWYEP
jgi:hypothetical protein